MGDIKNSNEPDLNFEDNISQIRNISHKLDIGDNFNKPTATLEELKRQRFEGDTESRNKLTDWLKCLITFYLFAVGCMVLFQNDIGTSDTVLIALLTTTTINVLGLLAIVLYSYFPKDS